MWHSRGVLNCYTEGGGGADFGTEQDLPEMEELYLQHTSEHMAKYKQVILFCSDNVHKHVIRVD